MPNRLDKKYFERDFFTDIASEQAKAELDGSENESWLNDANAVQTPSVGAMTPIQTLSKISTNADLVSDYPDTNKLASDYPDTNNDPVFDRANAVGNNDFGGQPMMDDWTVLGETAKAVSSGFNTAVNETLDFVLQDFNQWAWNSDIGKKINETLDLGLTEESWEQNQKMIDKIHFATDLVPETVGGKMGGSVVQFITGFMGAGKFLGASKAFKGADSISKAMAQGAVADFTVFDPSEKRLSDLMQEYPALQNPISEYLSNKEDDSALDGRLKNAVEGLGLGAVADGLFIAVKGLRAVRKAKQPQTSDSIVLNDTVASPVRQLVEQISLGVQFTVAKNFPTSKLASKIKTTITVADVERGIDKILVAQGLAKKGADGKVVLKQGNNARDGLKLETNQGMVKFVWNGKISKQDIVSLPKIVREFEPFKDGDSWVWQVKTGKNEMRYVVKNFETPQPVVSIYNVSKPELLGKLSKKKGEISTSNDLAFSPTKDTIEESGATLNSSRADISTDNVSPAWAEVKWGDHNINLARIDSPEKIAEVLGVVAGDTKIARSIDIAKRGKMTNEQIAEMANDIGLTADDLINRRDGQVFNAETAVASRNLLVASSENIAELAKVVADGKATTVEIYEFKQMLAKHSAIQAQVQGMTAEAGRLLNSFKIQATNTNPDVLQLMKTELGAYGGVHSAESMAQKIIDGVADGNSVSKVVGDASRTGFLNRLKWTGMEWWINGLLSSPKTHLVNMVGNVGAIGWRMGENTIASLISNTPVIGSGEIPMSDIAYQFYGFGVGIKDGFKLVGKMVRERQVLGLDEMDTGLLAKAENTHTSMLSSSGVEQTVRQIGVGNFKPFSKATIDNKVAVGMLDSLGGLVRTPGVMLGVSDGFFKAVNYRMSVAVESSRQAHQMGLNGTNFHSEVARLMDAPTDSMRKTALDISKEYTFTNDFANGGMMQSLSNFTNEHASAKLFLPFIRTPANLVTFSLSRTPMTIFAKETRRKLLAGGSSRDEMIAKLGAGSLIMSLPMFLDESDNLGITGSGFGLSAKEKQAFIKQGGQFNSFSTTNADGEVVYYEYKRTDPVGILLGLTTDLKDIADRSSDMMIEDETSEVLSFALMSAVQAFATNITSKTWSQGVMDLSNILGDPQRYLPQWAKSTVGSFAVPNILRSAVSIAGDGVVRDTVGASFLESVELDIMKSIPGLTDNVPPRLDLGGNEVMRAVGAGAIAPIKTSVEKLNAVDSFFLNKLKWSPSKPSRRIDTVKLTAWQYYDYQMFSAKPVTSGNAQVSSMPDMYSTLDTLIKADEFKSVGVDDQQRAIEKIVRKYRAIGKQLVMEKHQDLQQRIFEKGKK